MVEIKSIRSHSHHFQFLLTNWKTIICSIFFALFFIACNNEKPDKIGAIQNRSKMAKLHATEITTIISDSGITRYRISAPTWNMFDKAIEPYWEFPKGIHFERFDQNLKVDANIHCKYALYKVNQQLWELRGKVKATNLNGELFETEKLFWDEKIQIIYCDTFIKITTATKVLTGIGFQSDQSLTHYTIRRPQGNFVVDEQKEAQTATTAPITTAAPTTTTPTPQPKTAPTTAPPKYLIPGIIGK